MKNTLNVPMLAFSILVATSSVLPIGFEISFDGKDVSVNGQKMDGKQNTDSMSTKRCFTDCMWRFFGIYIGAACARKLGLKKNEAASTLLAASTAGSLLNDFFYRDIKRQTVATKIASTIGAIGGLYVASHALKNGIKDSTALGEKLGSAGAAALHKDFNAAKIYGAQALGEQVAMYVWGIKDPSKEPKTRNIAKHFGSSVGAALVSRDEKTRNYFMKEAVANIGAFQLASQMNTNSYTDYFEAHLVLKPLVRFAVNNVL